MFQRSSHLWYATWNNLYIFNFVPMFQRFNPLWYATWNNLYYTFNFVPMFQRSRHFWYAFWFYLQIFNFVPMFQRSRHLWYPLWFYLLTIGFANQVFLYGYLAIGFPWRCWGGRIHFMYCLTSQASPTYFITLTSFYAIIDNSLPTKLALTDSVLARPYCTFHWLILT